MFKLAVLRWALRTLGEEETQDNQALSNNVEGNEEKKRLAGSGLYSLTLPWQHDSPWIRVPTKTLKNQWVAVIVVILQILALRRSGRKQAEGFMAHLAVMSTGVSLPRNFKLTPLKVTTKSEARALLLLYFAGPGGFIVTASGFGLALPL